MAIDDRSPDTETGRRLAHFITVLKTRDRQNLLDVARDLWACPSYEEDLGDGPLRESYIDALFDIANIFRNIPDSRVLSPFGVNKPPLPDSVISSKSIDAWKRAYSMNDGRVRDGRDSSAREAAAYNLGTIYEKAHCHHTAVFWFKQSLKDARAVGLTEHILFNLTGVARNLNTIGNFVEATSYYDEILDLVEDLPPAEQVSSGLAHAAMFQLQHGDHARGENIMRTSPDGGAAPSFTIFRHLSDPALVLGGFARSGTALYRDGSRARREDARRRSHRARRPVREGPSGTRRDARIDGQGPSQRR